MHEIGKNGPSGIVSGKRSTHLPSDRIPPDQALPRPERHRPEARSGLPAIPDREYHGRVAPWEASRGVREQFDMPDREQSEPGASGERRGRLPLEQDIPDRESIGSFVRARRKANGMTQVELGELAGVGTRFVSELERGKPTLRMDKVNRLLAVFGKRLGLVDAPRPEGGE
jgi:y4mF family transcriptional regulator